MNNQNIKGYNELQVANQIMNDVNLRPVYKQPKLTKKAIGISFEELGCELKATYIVMEADGTTKEMGTIQRFVLTAVDIQLSKIDIITMLKLFHNCDVKYETV